MRRPDQNKIFERGELGGVRFRDDHDECLEARLVAPPLRRLNLRAENILVDTSARGGNGGVRIQVCDPEVDTFLDQCLEPDEDRVRVKLKIADQDPRTALCIADRRREQVRHERRVPASAVARWH
jgi:hypothetical protein